MLKLRALTVLTLGLIVLGACSDKEESDKEATDVTNTPSQVANAISTENPAVLSMGDALYVPQYAFLSETVRVYNEVIVGTVTDVLVSFDPRPGFLGMSAEEVVGPSPKSSWRPTEEELARPAGQDYSIYGISVDTVIQSKVIKAGDTIGVIQNGGTFEGTIYQLEEDPILQKGMRYLFFLEPYSSDLEEFSIKDTWGITYSGPPFGRFIVDDSGKVAAVAAAWLCEYCRGPRALHGLLVEDVPARIELAVAGQLKEEYLAPAQQSQITDSPVVGPVVTTGADGRPTIVATAAAAGSP